MFAGVMGHMLRNACGDFSGDHELFRLASKYTAALQAYQTRAKECGQSFKHMVLLEAAVQGWHVPALLFILFFTNIYRHACIYGKIA